MKDQILDIPRERILLGAMAQLAGATAYLRYVGDKSSMEKFATEISGSISKKGQITYKEMIEWYQLVLAKLQLKLKEAEKEIEPGGNH